MARRIEPSEGISRQVTSLCQVFSRPRLFSSWVIASTSGIAGLGRRERKHLQRPEAAAEVQVLIGGDVLVAEEQHLPVQERAADLAELLVRELCREIDAFDLRPDHGRQRAHGDGFVSARGDPGS